MRKIKEDEKLCNQVCFQPGLRSSQALDSPHFLVAILIFSTESPSSIIEIVFLASAPIFP